jgi:hypothetical protein
MAASDRITLICPDCGAANRAGEKLCFLCGQSLETTWTKSRALARESIEPITHAAGTKRTGGAGAFSGERRTSQISSLLLLIAVIVVCAGVYRVDPVKGLGLGVVVVPALLYTVFAAFESRSAGKPMDVFDKVGSFVLALAGVALIGLAAFIAFWMTCIPAAIISKNFGIGIMIGGTVGIAVAAYMTGRILMRRRRAPWGR